MKDLKKYVIEKKSLAHYSALESRCVYTCQTLKALELNLKRFVGTGTWFEIGLNQIKDLKHFYQTTDWLIGYNEQYRVIYLGDDEN